MRPLDRPLLVSFAVLAALLGLVALLAFAPTVFAQEAELSAEQEATAKSLEGKLIAPCCYTQPVAEHQSELSDSVKAEIRMLLVQGKSEDEILDVFVDKWGEEILAAPRASGFNWLAYVLPPIAVVFAGGILLSVLLRWRRREPQALAVEPVPTPAAPHDEELRRRVEQELDSFDV